MRDGDDLIDTAQMDSAWRKANRRTLMKAAPRPARTDAANATMRDGRTPVESENAAGQDIDALPGMLPLAETLVLKEHDSTLLHKFEYERSEGSLIELALAEEVVFDLCPHTAR
ncbi:hypothetical protein [Paraburkholderia sp. J12]|uniref:hypothetical protein n=1 Tax=Paraburkholderia sp. J12 TaxID=2805432 RepID=UPI002ABDCA19|nr:hypothetical protein [Paraburkholderia sp. J12]